MLCHMKMDPQNIIFRHIWPYVSLNKEIWYLDTNGALYQLIIMYLPPLKK